MVAGSLWPLPPGVHLPADTRWPVTLRAGGVVLRPLEQRDQDRWMTLRRTNADWLRRWEPTPPPFGDPPPATFRRMVRTMQAEGRADRLYGWVIGWDEGWPDRATRDSRVPMVGQLTLGALQWGSARSGQVGYWIDRTHAGRGIVPTAVALACDYAFACLRLHRIEVCIRPENANSLRVAAKLGLRHEGRRPAYLHINGAWADHEVFAVHEDEATDGLLVRLMGAPEASG